MTDEKKLLITTLVTLFVAFAGYLIKYINDIALARRRDKLDKIGKQLGDFYGPLYSLLKSNQQAWLSFRQKYKPVAGDYFDPNDPPTDEQVTAWRHYMKCVFMPANEKMYEIIVTKSNLLIEDEMPQCLLDLISHIVVYRAVVKNWDLGHTKENTSIIIFPNEVRKYIYEAFEKLKKEQYRLMNKG